MLIRAAVEQILLRVGQPNAGGSLIAAARRLGYPILISANAFAEMYPKNSEWCGSFKRFRLPPRARFEGMNVALDSGGFVAAVKFGDYRHSIEQYINLVASAQWAWWASMDYCCEPEVAGDRPTRLLRMAATVDLYYQCRTAARRRGLTDPMPVLQGWKTGEYLQSMEWYGFEQWPALVGVGSVCRRHIHGPDGLFEVIAALDRALPAGVRLHLFGVKSGALEALGNHPRIASVDSMAWDFAARRARPVGRDMQFRIECMIEWVEAQKKHLGAATRGSGIQGTLPGLFDGLESKDFESCVLEALALQHADLILSGDMPYLDAVWDVKRDAATAIAIARATPQSRRCMVKLEELIAGLGDRVEALYGQQLSHS